MKVTIITRASSGLGQRAAIQIAKPGDGGTPSYGSNPRPGLDTDHTFDREQRHDILGEKNSLAGPGSRDYDCDAVAHALDIGPDSSAAERTIDITTLGARTGTPRRVEVWFHQVDGRWFISGMPVRRNWYANLRAHPRFMVHLKHGVTADLPATAASVDKTTRRRVITAILDLQNRPAIAARVSQRQNLDDWLGRSPLIEIVFDDERLRTASSARAG